MLAINPKGRKVQITNEMWEGLRGQGFKLPVWYQYWNDESDVILVDRPIGGLGDAISLNFAVQGLKKKHDACSIVARLPTHLHAALPTVQGFVDDVGDPMKYRNVIDMDCPCDQYESSMGYQPDKSRARIFCDTAKVDLPRYNMGDGYPMDSGADFLRNMGIYNVGGNLVGIQVKSADSRKDYGLVYSLVGECLRKGWTPVVFDVDRKHSFDGRVCVIGRVPVSVLIGLVTCMGVMIAPDSALMHIAAVTHTPLVGLFGPTHGETTVECYHGPKTIIQGGCPKRDFPCYMYPGNSACALGDTDVRCMSGIGVKHIIKKAREMMSWRQQL